MAKFQGVLGTQVKVTGATTIVIDDSVMKNSTNTMWQYGCFGISATWHVGAGGIFSCYVVGDLNGVPVIIAGATNIGTTAAATTVLPLLNESTYNTPFGSTQTARLGIPTPRRIVFGNSAIAGNSYAAVVSAMLYSPE